MCTPFVAKSKALSVCKFVEINFQLPKVFTEFIIKGAMFMQGISGLILAFGKKYEQRTDAEQGKDVLSLKVSCNLRSKNMQW